MSNRKPRPSSKSAILAAAVGLAKDEGLQRFSRADVARRSKMAEATISYHFGQMPELRREVVKFAIDNEVLPILADARSDRASAELYTRMSADLKQKVAAYISR